MRSPAPSPISATTYLTRLSEMCLSVTASQHAQRSQSTAWKDFISAHMAVLAGTDFFIVEVLTWRGLVTYYVPFFIRLGTRRISSSTRSSASPRSSPELAHRQIRVSLFPKIPDNAPVGKYRKITVQFRA